MFRGSAKLQQPFAHRPGATHDYHDHRLLRSGLRVRRTAQASFHSPDQAQAGFYKAIHATIYYRRPVRRRRAPLHSLRPLPAVDPDSHRLSPGRLQFGRRPRCDAATHARPAVLCPYTDAVHLRFGHCWIFLCYSQTLFGDSHQKATNQLNHTVKVNFVYFL